MTVEVKIGPITLKTDGSLLDSSDIIIKNQQTQEVGGIQDVNGEHLAVLFTMAQRLLREGKDINRVSEQLNGAETILFAVKQVLENHLHIPPAMLPDIIEKVRQELESMFDEWQREKEK